MPPTIFRCLHWVRKEYILNAGKWTPVSGTTANVVKLSLQTTSYPFEGSVTFIMLVYLGSPWFTVSHRQTVTGLKPHVTVSQTLPEEDKTLQTVGQSTHDPTREIGYETNRDYSSLILVKGERVCR